jgi:transposase
LGINQLSEHTMKLNMDAPVAVGIDVAKATLSVSMCDHKGQQRALSIRNTDTDITNKVLPYLHHYSGTVVMESTGHYHWTPALILREAGIDVRVVNPLLAKQYTSGNIRKVKTDPADARGLARMSSVCDHLPDSFTVSRERLIIRKKLATISTMSRHFQALKANLASLREGQVLLHETDTSVVLELAQSIKQLGVSIKHLEVECIQLTEADETSHESMEHLQTIPGVSKFCAALVTNWFVIDTATSAKSLIGYAGLDVSSRESGTWKGHCRLTKRGNPFLRKRLYSAGWGAVMNYPEYRAYYDQLKASGRGHKEAVVIIARKLVRTIYGVLRDGVPYDAEKVSFPKLVV